MPTPKRDQIDLTVEEKERIPRLYSGEETPTDAKVVHVKFFCPWNNWTWYVFEWDGADMFFGYVDGHELEMGYFTLSELKSVEHPKTKLRIERDIHWTPKPWREVKQEVTRRHGETHRSL